MKQLKIEACKNALIIFLGIILVQMIVYILAVVGVVSWGIINGISYNDAVKNMDMIVNQEQSFVMWMSVFSALISMLWCARLYNKSSWREENINYREVFSKENILALTGVAIGGCMVVSFILTVLAAWFPAAFKSYSQTMDNFDASGGIIVLVYTIVIGPAAEEFIFRGAIFDRLYLGFDFWKANMLQALLFALYHMDIVQGIYAFIMGIVLGMVLKATGSIITAIITYILFNATSYIISVVFNGKNELQIVFWIVLIFSVISLTAGIMYFKRKLTEKLKVEKC